LKGTFVNRLNSIHPNIAREPEQAQKILCLKGPDSKQHIFVPTVSKLKQLKHFCSHQPGCKASKYLE